MGAAASGSTLQITNPPADPIQTGAWPFEIGHNQISVGAAAPGSTLHTKIKEQLPGVRNDTTGDLGSDMDPEQTRPQWG